MHNQVNAEVKLEGVLVGHTAQGLSADQLIASLSEKLNLPKSSLYAVQNGKICDVVCGESPVDLRFRVLGGKGGFGSMLRAIGAQIEKTTNREACRDLSGRRLRDIREEQRLRNWAANQPQREEEARRRKEEKLKKLCAEPPVIKHEFNDAEYEAARRNLEEAGEASIEAGTKAVQLAPERKPKPIKRKRPNLWIDDEISEPSSGESGCEDDGSDGKEASADVRSVPTTSSAPMITKKGKGIGKKSRIDSPAPQESDSGNESDKIVL